MSNKSKQALDEFVSESGDDFFKWLSSKERLEGLSPEQRLEGLSAEDVVKGLSPAALEELVRQVEDNGPPAKPQ